MIKIRTPFAVYFSQLGIHPHGCLAPPSRLPAGALGKRSRVPFVSFSASVLDSVLESFQGLMAFLLTFWPPVPSRHILRWPASLPSPSTAVSWNKNCSDLVHNDFELEFVLKYCFPKTSLLWTELCPSPVPIGSPNPTWLYWKTEWLGGLCSYRRS